MTLYWVIPVSSYFSLPEGNWKGRDRWISLWLSIPLPFYSLSLIYSYLLISDSYLYYSLPIARLLRGVRDTSLTSTVLPLPSGGPGQTS